MKHQKRDQWIESLRKLVAPHKVDTERALWLYTLKKSPTEAAQIIRDNTK